MSNVHRVGLLIIARCSDIDWSVCCNSIIDKPTLSRLTSEECFSVKGCQGESIQTVDNLDYYYGVEYFNENKVQYFIEWSDNIR